MTLVTLAEISDKMPTIAGMWVRWTILALIFAGFAAINRWGALVVLGLVVAFAQFWARSTYHEVYLEGLFSDDIWRELGVGWVRTSFMVPFLPVVATLPVVAWKWRPIPKPVLR